MKEIWYKYKPIITAVLIFVVIPLFITIISSCISYKVGYKKGKKEKKIIYTPPVEKKVIDTLYITRDSLITRVKYLETIKHDTIEKVYILNDSATIDLFYKLVSE